MARIYQQTVTLKKSMPELATQLLKHFQARQETGRAIILSKDADQLARALSVRWGHLTRGLQAERDQSENIAEKLRLTRQVIHMQHYTIGADSHGHQVLCLSPAALKKVALGNYMTIYILDSLSEQIVQQLASRLPENSLVVAPANLARRIRPLVCGNKTDLEAEAHGAWQDVANLLEIHGINLETLANPLTPDHSNMMNEALETLLDDRINREFLSSVNDYRLAARLAAPFRLNAEQKRQRKLLMALALQVQSYALTNQSAFIESFDEPSFYLNDRQRATDQLAPISYCAPLPA
jgi:hypothetical protein